LQSSGSRARWAAGAVGALVLVAALVGAYLLIRSGPDTIVASGNSVAVIDLETNRVVSVIPVGTAPTSIVRGAGAVWTLNTGEQTISEIDAAKRERIRTFSAGVNASDIAFSKGAVWVVDAAADTLVVLDPLGRVEDRITLGLRHAFTNRGFGRFEPRAALTTRAGEVWAVGGDDLTAVVVGSASRDVIRRTVGFQGANGDSAPGGPDVASGGAGIWATDGSDELFRTDTSPDERAQLGGFDGDQGITGIAVDRDTVWVSGAGVVWQVRTNPVRPSTTYPVGEGPAGVAVGGGAVWTANAYDGTVSRIDVGTGKTTTITVGGTPSDLVVANGLLWVTVD
jgi:YVTN family beta-propeller protein